MNFLSIWIKGLRRCLVSRLLNFLAMTRPGSRPSRAQINFVNSGWEEPPKTLIFGILEFKQGRCSSVDRRWKRKWFWLESESVLVLRKISSWNEKKKWVWIRWIGKTKRNIRVFFARLETKGFLLTVVRSTIFFHLVKTTNKQKKKRVRSIALNNKTNERKLVRTSQTWRKSSISLVVERTRTKKTVPAICLARKMIHRV